MLVNSGGTKLDLSFYIYNVASQDHKIGQAAAEFRVLTPNRPYLEALARRAGGEVLTLDALRDFVRRLPQRHAPVMEPWSRPLWHQPAVFLFALACFVAEWGIRRWKGLP